MLPTVPEDGDRQERQLRVLAGEEVPRDAAEDQRVGEPVRHRVDEGSPRRGGACGLGDDAIEGVHAAARDEQCDAGPEVAETDRVTGCRREADSDRGDRVRAHPEGGEAPHRARSSGRFSPSVLAP